MSLRQRPLLALDGFSMSPRGRRLTLEVFSGDLWAVMGVTGSGKSRFLEHAEGTAAPPFGQMLLAGSVASAGIEPGRRLTPEAIARRSGRGSDAGRVVQSLSVLGLWDVRKELLTKLRPSQEAACELLPILAGAEDIGLIDGQLDLLDPWTLAETLDYLAAEAKLGRAFLAATNRIDVAERMGRILLLRDGGPRFAGTTSQLRTEAKSGEVYVQTDDPAGVASMVEPFVISARRVEEGLILKAEDGQALAARLLLEGYGSLKLALVKEPTLGEALAALY